MRLILVLLIFQTSQSANLDFETSGSPSITVLVEDNGSPKLSYQKTFTVEIEDVNEAPTQITLSNTQVGLYISVTNVPNCRIRRHLL